MKNQKARKKNFISWLLTLKKAECRRIDAFEMWCWRRLLRVSWTVSRSNQFILKQISPEYSLERLMLKLKLNTLASWCKELTHWKRLWCWESLKVGGKGDDRGWDGWMASLTRWTWVWASSDSWWWTGKPGVLQSMGSQRVRHDWVAELNWTESLYEWGQSPGRWQKTTTRVRRGWNNRKVWKEEEPETSQEWEEQKSESGLGAQGDFQLYHLALSKEFSYGEMRE